MRIMSMRVRVSRGLMVVRVCVRHLLQLSGPVLVLVVFIVLVLMRVIRGLVAMLMLVNIGAEQDGAARHPGESQERRRVYGFVEKCPRQQCREARS